MDTITHALSGALFVQALHLPRLKRLQQVDPLPYWLLVLTGFLVGAFPDADAISSWFGTLAYLNHHRGITHSIFMIPLWAGLLAVFLSILSRQRYQWQQFYWVCFVAIAIHIAGDVITAYGTMIYAPFSNTKVSWPVTFIIDLYFSGIILFSLLACMFIRTHRQKIAIVGMLVLLSYVGAQGLLRQQALDIARQYANINDIDTAQRQLEAIAQPLSPFNWKLMILEQDSYHIAYLDLLNKQSENSIEKNTADSFYDKVSLLYKPETELEWIQHSKFGNNLNEVQEVRDIWQSEVLYDIRRFMLFPTLSRVVNNEQGFCVWFVDQRFILAGIRTPFQFGACRQTGASLDLIRFKDNKIMKIK